MHAQSGARWLRVKNLIISMVGRIRSTHIVLYYNTEQ